MRGALRACLRDPEILPNAQDYTENDRAVQKNKLTRNQSKNIKLEQQKS